MGEPKSYKQVGLAVRRMRARGVPPAVIAQRRAEMWSSVTMYRQKTDRMRKTLPVPGRERLDALLNDVAECYAVNPHDMYDRPKAAGVGRRNPISMARRSFVVAARALEYSSTELAVYLRRPGAHSSILFMESVATDDERAIADAALVRDHERCEKERAARERGEDRPDLPRAARAKRRAK